MPSPAAKVKGAAAPRGRAPSVDSDVQKVRNELRGFKRKMAELQEGQEHFDNLIQEELKEIWEKLRRLESRLKPDREPMPLISCAPVGKEGAFDKGDDKSDGGPGGSHSTASAFTSNGGREVHVIVRV